MNLALSMLLGNITLALGTQVALALIGTARLLKITKLPVHQDLKRAPMPLGVIVGMFVCFVLLVMQVPVSEWDPRSIWFYHAKVIYFTNDIWAGGQWAEHAQGFSHRGYPKLFPLLAAQCAVIFGFWNEYVPKLALPLLALPIVSFLYESAFSHETKRLSFLTLLLFGATLFLFDGAGFFLTSGYMDGWVALYTVCTALATGELIDSIPSEQVLRRIPRALVLAGVLCQLKQEGLVLALTLAVLAVGVSVAKVRTMRGQRQPRRERFEKRQLFGLLAVAMIAFVPALAWQIGARLQGIARDHYSGNMTERIVQRLNAEGVPEWIVSNVLFHNPITVSALMLAVSAAFCAWLIRTKVSWGTFLLALLALSYASVLTFVYAATSADVNWHMKYSAGRTGLVIALLLLTFSCRIMLSLKERLLGRRSGSE